MSDHKQTVIRSYQVGRWDKYSVSKPNESMNDLDKSFICLLVESCDQHAKLLIPDAAIEMTKLLTKYGVEVFVLGFAEVQNIFFDERFEVCCCGDGGKPNVPIA